MPHLPCEVVRIWTTSCLAYFTCPSKSTSHPGKEWRLYQTVLAVCRTMHNWCDIDRVQTSEDLQAMVVWLQVDSQACLQTMLTGFDKRLMCGSTCWSPFWHCLLLWVSPATSCLKWRTGSGARRQTLMCLMSFLEGKNHVKTDRN